MNNCTGGATPWGWVSCEESDADGHGWAFLCPADAEALRPARPLRSWGRFRPEAVALDPRSRIVCQTEDHPQGALYRHVPDDPADPLSEPNTPLRPTQLSLLLSLDARKGERQHVELTRRRDEI